MMKLFVKVSLDNHIENFYNLMLFLALFIPVVCCIRILLLLGTSFFDSLLIFCQ